MSGGTYKWIDISCELSGNLRQPLSLTEGKAPKQTRDTFGQIFVFRIFFPENQVLGKKIHWF